MKVADAVGHMTALYRRRIIDNFTKDFPKPEESRARKIILQNVDELTEAGKIDRKLMDSSHPYSTRILHHDVLAAPPDKAEQAGAEDGVFLQLGNGGGCRKTGLGRQRFGVLRAEVAVCRCTRPGSGVQGLGREFSL